MAKFVLAGKADCPYYAKAENLGDFLQKNLPDFRLHKISVHPSDWQVWLQNTCKLNGWNHSRSPIVWRELIDRGGKGVLLGGFSEFLEHAQGYYDITSDMPTDLMLKIALENLRTKELTMEEHEEVVKEKALRLLHIWISSALNPVCYSLIPQLFSSSLFPEHKMISLHLVELGGSDAVLQALKMETEDLASHQLQEVTLHADQNVDFQEADLIVFLDDSMTNLESVDYQKHVVERFCGYGKLINANARKTVKVMVAGEACVNLKCSLLAKNAPSVDSRNFVTMSLQRECEAKNLLAQKLFVRSADITDVIVWGNVNGSYHIDLQRAKVSGYDGAVCGPEGFSQGVLEMIYDQKWVEMDFERLVQKRQSSIFSKTNRATAMSTTNGIIRTLKAWNDGRSPDGVFSLGVVSAGEFGIPEGLVLSMPVSIQEGRWSARTDVTLTDELWPQLEASIEELEKQEQEIGAQGLDSDPQRQQ